MARIAGVDLPREKRVEIGLTYIYGIGRKTEVSDIEEVFLSEDRRRKQTLELEKVLKRL